MSRLSSSSVAISPSLFASAKWSDSFSLIEKEIILKISTYVGKKFFRRKVECKSSACIFLQVMMLFEESCTYKQHHNNKEYNHSEEGTKRCKLIPNSKLSTVPNPIIREETCILYRLIFIISFLTLFNWARRKLSLFSILSTNVLISALISISPFLLFFKSSALPNSSDNRVYILLNHIFQNNMCKVLLIWADFLNQFHGVCSRIFLMRKLFFTDSTNLYSLLVIQCEWQRYLLYGSLKKQPCKPGILAQPSLTSSPL